MSDRIRQYVAFSTQSILSEATCPDTDFPNPNLNLLALVSVPHVGVSPGIEPFDTFKRQPVDSEFLWLTRCGQSGTEQLCRNSVHQASKIEQYFSLVQT
jgi:hypothetical protein